MLAIRKVVQGDEEKDEPEENAPSLGVKHLIQYQYGPQGMSEAEEDESRGVYEVLRRK